MNNLFGLGPKALFWLRLTSYASQTGVFSAMLSDFPTYLHGRATLAIISLIGLTCGAIASGNPVLPAK